MANTDTPASVLIIDDDKLLLASLAQALMGAGYRVIVSASGQDGLAHALKYRPDLILLDCQMPGMDGIETLEKLRQDDWGRDVNVIFSTNVGDFDIINKVMSHGVNTYILKSETSLDEIVSLVSQNLPARA